MKKKTLTLVMVVLTVLATGVQAISAQKVTIQTQTMVGKELKLPGILHKPSGEGPFPAIVMLCGAGGYGSEPDATQQSTWAERLVSWGYVALQLDSFSPRGYPNGVNDNTLRVDNFTRARDAFSAKFFLSTLAYVDPKNIAVIGWSHGGWAVMSIIDAYARDKDVSPFKAAVAFYPYCSPVQEPDTPVLVLIGKKDDWCPASLAESVKEDYRVKNWKPEFSLTVYPNASHAFDYETTPPEGRVVQGHHLEYDPEATSDAINQTKAFLAKYCSEQ